MQHTIACWPKRLAVTAPGCTGEPLSLTRHLRRLLCGSTGSGRSTAASALARAARPSAQAAQAGGRHRSSAWQRTCTRLQTAASLAATVTHLRAREPARTPVQGPARAQQPGVAAARGTRVGFSRATCARHQHCSAPAGRCARATAGGRRAGRASAANDGPLRKARRRWNEAGRTRSRILSTVSSVSFRMPFVHDTSTCAPAPPPLPSFCLPQVRCRSSICALPLQRRGQGREGRARLLRPQVVADPLHGARDVGRRHAEQQQVRVRYQLQDVRRRAQAVRQPVPLRAACALACALPAIGAINASTRHATHARPTLK